jgi:hypothetical protein
MLVGIGFLMLLLTSLQGWGMVGIIAFASPGRSEILDELRRLHNLGLSGGFLAISFGLTLVVLPLPESRSRIICRVLLPSLLIAPVAFCDRILAILVGTIPFVLQAFFFILQAVSALGITVSLALIVILLFRDSYAITNSNHSKLAGESAWR